VKLWYFFYFFWNYMQYEIKKIAGIETILAPMEEVNSVTVQILVKAGSNYETRETNGISHFLEHMFFKWGKKYTTPKAVAETVDEFGGEFNAFTSGLYAGYYVKCAPEFVSKAVDVLGDMLVNAQFPKAELEREKGVIVQEIMMKQDNPSSLVYEHWKKYYFGDNSFWRATLGTVDNVNSFTQDMFFEHKNALYTKDNLLLIVSWKFWNQENLEDLLAEHFAELPDKKTLLDPVFEEYLPKKQKDFFEKKTEQNHIIIASKWFDGNDEKRYAANLLATILWWNMSSRLFQNVREKEWLCYYIGGSHYALPYTGMFLFRAGLEKGRFDFGVEKIYSEIADIASGNFEQKEFEKAVGYRKGQIQMGIESSDEMASFLGEQYLLYGRIETLDEILVKYEKQDLVGLKEVADRLLAERLYLYWIE